MRKPFVIKSKQVKQSKLDTVLRSWSQVKGESTLWETLSLLLVLLNSDWITMR